MLETTFFCIRPYIFEKRSIIKNMLANSNLPVKESTPVWLTEEDLKVLYGHEKPSLYYDASLRFMTDGFCEVGIIEAKDAIERLVQAVSDEYIPDKSGTNTIRAIFGRFDPVLHNDFQYYLNPMHRSRTKAEAKREVSFFTKLKTRPPTTIISNMIEKMHRDRDLMCVFDNHIKVVVQTAKDICQKHGGDATVCELAAWLHDIASLSQGDKHEHHIEGANKSKNILRLFAYSDEVINNVLHCIQVHRGNYPLTKMTTEAEIVCSADGIANLMYPSLLFLFAFKIQGLGYEAGIKKIKRKIDRSYKKIAPWLKEYAQPYYDQWRKIL